MRRAQKSRGVWGSFGRIETPGPRIMVRAPAPTTYPRHAQEPSTHATRSAIHHALITYTFVIDTRSAVRARIHRHLRAARRLLLYASTSAAVRGPTKG